MGATNTHPRPALLRGALQTSPGLQVGLLRGPAPLGPAGNRTGKLRSPFPQEDQKEGMAAFVEKRKASFQDQ